MLRPLVAIVLIAALSLSSCARLEDEGSSDTLAAPSTTTTTATTTTTSVPAPTDPTTTTALPPTTVGSTTTAASEDDQPSVVSLDSGLFCRDLDALGYGYVDAVAYWVREGQPDRMDADRNGIPCETVYRGSDVVAFWGDVSARSTTTTAGRDVQALGPGLLCRDLAAAGMNFDQAVAYWMLEGMPARMDADGNDVPCQTVYPSSEIADTYGPDDALALYLVTTVGTSPIPRFEASGPAVDAGMICASGTADWVGGHESRWEDEYICDDGSGTFIAGADIHIMRNDRLYESWTIVSGTGAYAKMTGGGGADTGPTASGLWQDHMYGRITNPGD